MHTLVRQYVVSRGLRVAVVVLLGVLGVVAAGFLPMRPGWVVLRLLLLLGGLLWAFHTLKTPTLAFFLTTLVALLLFHLPLHLYVNELFAQASSLTVFMIVLFGGTLAVVSRQDLLMALPPDPQTARPSPEQTRLHREAAVVCLLRRFDTWIQRTVASTFWRGVLLFPLVLANFVSSGPAVLFFKSLWMPPNADVRTREADRALAAGILCLCTSGVLLVYTGAGRLMSPWWLFFRASVSDPAILPTWPVAVYLYGLLSFAHGIWLILGRSRPATAADQRPVADVQVQRLQGLYLALLLVCFAAVALAFVVGAQGQPATALPQDEPLDQRLVVSAVFVGVLLAVLLAQGLMYSLFLRPAVDVWQPGTFWSLLLQGMQGVFGTVVTLVVILAFKDILTTIMHPLTAHPVVPPTWGDTLWGQGIILGVVFVLTFGIGRLIGTAWGTFTIGVLLFTMSGLQLAGVETVVEALIVLATWINQSSLNADNVYMMLGPAQLSRDTLGAVWSVPTVRWYPKLQARYVQYGILALSIALALVLRKQWPGVF